jgi:DNA polymerase-1
LTGTLHNPEGVLSGTPSYLLVTEAAGLGMVAAALEETTLVGLDLETTGLDPRRNRVRLLSLNLDTTDGKRFSYLVDCFQVDPSPLWEALTGKILMGHNLAFDLAFLGRMGFEPGAVRDTMLLSQLVYAGRHVTHKLQDCVRREFGRTLDKEAQKSDWSGTLTPEQLAYAALDVDVLPSLFRALDAKVKAAGLEAVADIEHRALPALVWLARSGVAFDVATWQGLAADAAEEVLRLVKGLDAIAPRPDQPGMFAGFGWNWDSPRQVTQVFAALGIVLESTDDDHLAKVNDPLAALLRKYRQARKRCTTYGTGWLQHVADDGRVYAEWRQIGAASGRMSCSSPNLQQMPRGQCRRCFQAPPGRLLVKADYSQIELRIAAKISGDAAMLQAYQSGQDLHTLTAQNLLGSEKVTKEDRQIAKSANFGLLYGMGAERYQAYAQSNYGVELTLDQAADLRRSFFRAYPGLTRWHRSVPNKLIDTRTLIGRRRLAVERFTEKLNTPVQGTGADGLKLALALLWERREQAPGAFPVLVVHDEIVVECDEAHAEAAAMWLKAAMVDAMAEWLEPVPIEVEASIARTWGIQGEENTCK